MDGSLSSKMTVSRLETNIRRLLKHTECLSRDDSTSMNWRLEKYVKALTDMLSEIQKRPKKPDSETLNGYIRRIEFLKKLVDSQKIDNPVEKIVALQMMSKGVSSPDGISREIQQKTASEFNVDAKNELFGNDKESKSEIRHRREEKSTGEDLDSLMKYHQSVQEKIVSDMLMMTQDLKEQTKLANTIIKKDIETLYKSSGLADQNLTRLKIESAQLEEHNKRAWRCWMWILILVVMLIFICQSQKVISALSDIMSCIEEGSEPEEECRVRSLRENECEEDNPVEATSRANDSPFAVAEAALLS